MRRRNGRVGSVVKAIILRWREIGDHEVTVSVPDDFDLDADYADNIANDVASLGDGGYQGCERGSFEFEDVGYDTTCEILYDDLYVGISRG